MRYFDKQIQVHGLAPRAVASLTLSLIALAGCGSPVRHVQTAQPESATAASSDSAVPVGTTIPVVALAPIASRDGVSDQPTASGQEPHFAVLQNITNSRGTVVLHEGTQVMASITRRKNPRKGRPGWVEVSFKSTTGADGTVVRLDDSPQRLEGKNRVKGSMTLAVLTFGLGLLRTGGDVTVPEGSALVARVVN